MADPAWWPQQADLERKLRSAGYLAQLGDPDGTGTVDPAFVTNCLSVGRGKVRKAALVKHTAEALDALTGEQAIIAKRAATIYAAQVAWSDGAGGQAMPQVLVDDVLWADQELESIRRGEGFIGGESGQASPPLRQFLGVVDPDPLRTGMSVAALRQWGFR